MTSLSTPHTATFHFIFMRATPQVPLRTNCLKHLTNCLNNSSHIASLFDSMSSYDRYFTLPWSGATAIHALPLDMLSYKLVYLMHTGAFRKSLHKSLQGTYTDSQRAALACHRARRTAESCTSQSSSSSGKSS